MTIDQIVPWAVAMALLMVVLRGPVFRFISGVAKMLFRDTAPPAEDPRLDKLLSYLVGMDVHLGKIAINTDSIPRAVPDPRLDWLGELVGNTNALDHKLVDVIKRLDSIVESNAALNKRWEAEGVRVQENSAKLFAFLEKASGAVDQAIKDWTNSLEKTQAHAGRLETVAEEVAHTMSAFLSVQKEVMRAMYGTAGTDDDAILERARALRERFPGLELEDALKRAKVELQYRGQ